MDRRRGVLPFVMGLGHYSPARLAAIQPQYGTPHVSLLVQAVLSSLVPARGGGRVHDARRLPAADRSEHGAQLLDLVIHIRGAGDAAMARRRKHPRVTLIPGGPMVCWLVAAAGMSAMVFAKMVPPDGSASRVLFIIKGAGGCVLVFASGFIIAKRGQRRLSNP